MAGESLGDVAEIIMGQSPPGETCNTEGIGLPLLNGPTEYGPHHPSPVQFTTNGRKRARPGDILFCVRGSTTGRMNWADRDYAIGRGVAAIRHKKQPELQPFVRAVIDFSLADLLAQATGSTFPNVAADQLAAIPWPDLPVDEQRAIAHILGTLDDKIELNRRMSETLEAMARALFKSWFVDFDPVRAKMEGRWRKGQSLPGLPAHLYDLFPARLVESELGEIPEGWEVVWLTDLIEINPSRPLRKDERAPYLDMANMPTRGHAPDEVVNRPYGSGMRFINGDTLMARITPCLENGKTAFVDFLQDGQVGWGSTEFIVLRPRPPLPEEFAYCLARGETFRDFAIQSMTGTSGRQRVQADLLGHYRLPRASAAVASAFGHVIKPLFVRSSASVRESRTLTALRDALLPKLISGELRVKDAERFVERLAV
jgi:type I restriction enzyme S subunit